jgi:hypothetical protein
VTTPARNPTAKRITTSQWYGGQLG